MMDEGRPIRFLPSFGHPVTVTFGLPITDKLHPLLDEHSRRGLTCRPSPPPYLEEDEATRSIRSRLATLMRSEVEALGRRANELC